MEQPILNWNAAARLAFDAMGDKQAEDLVLLDLRPVSPIADYFVIGTAGSTRQMRAVAESVVDRLREELGMKPGMIEGAPESGWMLVDYGGLIVHVFDPERRAYYDLEGMWSAAPLVARMA